MVAAHDHLRPRVDRPNEVIPQIRVHLKGYVEGGGPAGHEERVGEDVPLLVGPVVLVLDRVDDDPIQELEDSLLDARLDAGRASFLQERGDGVERLALDGGELRWFEDSKRRGSRFVRNEAGGGRAAKGQLILGRGRDDLVAGPARQSIEGLRRRDVGLVRGDDHRFPSSEEGAGEAEEILRRPPGHFRIHRLFPEGEVDLRLRQAEASEPPQEDFFGRLLRKIGPPRLLLPVAGEDARDPVGQFVLEEPQVFQRVMATGRDRVPLEIGTAGRIDHMDEGARLAKIVEELVPQSAALMSLGYEPRHVNHLDRDQTGSILAGRVFRVARAAEFEVGTPPADIGYAVVRLDRGEGIVRDVDWGERRRREERRLPHVWLADDPQLHQANKRGPSRCTLAAEGRAATYARRRLRRKTRIHPAVPTNANNVVAGSNSGAGTMIELSWDVPLPS